MKKQTNGNGDHADTAIHEIVEPTLDTLAVSQQSLDLLQGGIVDMRRQRAELAAELKRMDEVILRQEGAIQLMAVLVKNGGEK